MATRKPLRSPRKLSRVQIGLAEGMREESLKAVRAARRGKKALPPVRINVYAKEGAIVGDGRHRLLVAYERGDKTIDAEVWHYGPRGGLRGKKLIKLSLDAPPKGVEKASSERGALRWEREKSRKAREKREKTRAAEKRREEKLERKRIMRNELEPLLRKMIRDTETGKGVRTGLASRENHINWYEKKMQFAQAMGLSEYEAILQAISNKYRVEDRFGWNIVY